MALWEYGMDFKQAMLATIRGEPTPLIPWVPRLDLWYRANQLAGTLPKGYEGAPLAEIAAGLQAGMHAIVPNFKDPDPRSSEVDRGLGVYNLRCMPFRVVFQDVQRSIALDGDRTTVEYRTPKGTIRTVTVYDAGMKRDGITISHVVEHAFKRPADYEALGYLFRHARVEPNYEGYREYAESIGNKGLAAGFLSLAASPMHLIQRELMPLDLFFYEMNDHPDELAALADQIGFCWERMLAVAADCPAEIFLLGANYDARFTYPPFFASHIRPWLKRFADMLHSRGKLLLTHTDGENAGLLEHYVQSGLDVADSICPAPMTSLTFRQTRDAFDGSGITIMGGIPSIALLPQSMPDREFEHFLDQFFEDIGRGDRLILGISDTTPPAADFRRLQAIGRRVQQFGEVRPS
jgi:hypothetical protein